MTSSRFKPGNHLRVRRHGGLYWHHGVFVDGDDALVVEFGGRVKDKLRAVVREVSLTEFEDGGVAEVVRHPSQFLFGLGEGLPASLTPDEVIARARWMVGKCPKGNYDLVGSNCEHLANWAVTGVYFESLQVRRLFGVLPIATLVLMAGQRLNHRDPRWTWAILGVTVIGVAGPLLYHTVPRRLWREVIDQWPGYDALGNV